MSQTLSTHLQRLLAYHGWAYARLLDELAPLSEEQYRGPCGLFFHSIHSTLNHLAMVDRVWLARACAEPPPFTSPDQQAADDLAGFTTYLEIGVAAWRSHLADLNDSDLLAPIAYRDMSGAAQQRSLLDIVTHLVNHGSHHRGQISAALTAFGRPAPVLDYIFALPELP